MEFPENFNQLELLESHSHLIPTGTQSLWPEDDEDVGERSEEWYEQQEQKLEGQPGELLLWAAEHNRLSTVQRLLAVDSSPVRCRDEDGYTPLHRAAYGGHLDAACCLLSSGAEVNARTVDGWTPLHSACRWGQVAMASLLLRRGAELNAQTNGGLTPLHLASAHNGSGPLGHAPLLELLLTQPDLKADLRSASGETAYEVARRCSAHHFLFEMLEPCNNVIPPP